MTVSELETKQCHVQSVSRALSIVELLARENREMTLTEISHLMGWPKSTTYGLLVTLRDYNYVTQSVTSGRYALGVRLFELGNVVARSWNIREIAYPIMQQLNAMWGETIQLAIEDNGEVLYLEKLESNHLIRIVSEVGTRLPMHCTGLGKAMLAWKTPSEVKWILTRHGMKAMTPRTITNMNQIDKELEKIRRQGYAEDVGEMMDSLRCVAVPIKNKDGRVKHAISISGIDYNMQGERWLNIVSSLQKAADDISYAIGYRKESV